MKLQHKKSPSGEGLFDDHGDYAGRFMHSFTNARFFTRWRPKFWAFASLSQATCLELFWWVGAAATGALVIAQASNIAVENVNTRVIDRLPYPATYSMRI
jgi:hypothetical protein